MVGPPRPCPPLQCIQTLLLRTPTLRSAPTLHRISFSNASYPRDRRPLPRQCHFYPQLHRQQNQSFHSSSSVSSSTISRIQSFKRDEDGSLHFIISSRGSSANANANDNGNESEGRVPTKIYSPALFLPTDGNCGGEGGDGGDKITQGKEYDSSSSSSVRDEIINDISEAVESHYTLDNRDQFVGGMGENDGGVWFVADNFEPCDTLDYWEHIRDVISSIKQSRHGIPFGIYTSGLIRDKDIANDLKGAIGISSMQVTLGSGDPISYGEVVAPNAKGSQTNSAFGEVCNFIVSSAESGFPVTAAVAGGKHAGPGSELAKALGAVDVVVYDRVP